MAPASPRRTAVAVLALVAVLAVIPLAFLVAPAPSSPPFAAPAAFRLFYFHVPAAWAGYLAFTVTFVESVRYLRSRDRDRDRLAAASAEVGTVLISIALFTGMVWARAEWGVFWFWGDIKLVLVLVLWLTYLGYNALRGAVEDPDQRARASAVFGIAGFVAVPLSYLAGQIWITPLHPNLAGRRAVGPLPAGMEQVLLASVLAFTLLYVALTWIRRDLARTEDTVRDLTDAMEEI